MSNLLLGLLLGLAIGVGATLFVVFVMLAAPPLPSLAFGEFLGKPSPAWDDDGRTMTLDADFVYVDPRRKPWVARQGLKIDGASIPQPFWSIIGGPFEGQYRNASIVHDAACVEKTEPSADVHQMFYFACRCGGVPETKAKALYYAVSKYGPKWQRITVTQATDDGDGRESIRIESLEAPMMTEQDAAAIVEFFAKNNPPLGEIPSVKIDAEP